ncbi:MAG: hypothetical protein H7Y37_08900 [Anaerolineae bacterium]|nr:hypothetical protein [Gloeobacterales cyanobacterium ES-bin-313]
MRAIKVALLLLVVGLFLPTLTCAEPPVPDLTKLKQLSPEEAGIYLTVTTDKETYLKTDDIFIHVTRVVTIPRTFISPDYGTGNYDDPDHILVEDEQGKKAPYTPQLQASLERGKKLLERLEREYKARVQKRRELGMEHPEMDLIGNGHPHFHLRPKPNDPSFSVNIVNIYELQPGVYRITYFEEFYIEELNQVVKLSASTKIIRL